MVVIVIVVVEKSRRYGDEKGVMLDVEVVVMEVIL